MIQTAQRQVQNHPSEATADHIAVVAAGFIVVFFGFGCYYGFPIYYPALIHAFGWSRSQIAGGASLALLVSGLLSPLVGTLADRRGPRFVIACGSLLAGAAILGLGFSSNLLFVYIAFALFGVGMSGFSLMVMQMLMAQWFIRRRGLATGMVIAGMGLGGSAAPLVIAPILLHSSWRTGFFLQGTALIAVGCPAILLLVRARSSTISSPLTAAAPPALAGVPYREALRMANFWLLAAASFFAMFAAATALQHTVLYLRELRIPLNEASRTLSLMLLASVAGRLMLGWLSDYLTRRRTLLLAYLFLTCGMALLTAPPTGTRLLIMALLVGIGYGGAVVMMTLTTAEIFGRRSLGQILGTVVFCFTLGGALGPILVGRLVDAHLAYRLAFMVAAASAACAVVCAAALRRSSPDILLQPEEAR